MLIWTSQSTLYRYNARAYVNEKERFSGNMKLRVYITVYVSLQEFLLSKNRKEADATYVWIEEEKKESIQLSSRNKLQFARDLSFSRRETN